MSGKGQVSIESVTIVGILLMVFSIISYVSLTRQQDVKRIDNILDHRLECSRIYNEIVNVYNMGEGASSQLDLGMNITVLGHRKRVFMGNFYCILCCNVTNENGEGYFNLCQGYTNLTNSEEGLVLSDECSSLHVELISPGG